MKFTFLVAALALFGACAIRAQSNPCVGELDKHAFDLTALQNNADDYTIIHNQNPNPYIMRLNMCRALITNCTGNPKTLPGAAGCQAWDYPNTQYTSTMGLANTMKIGRLTDDSGNHRGFTASFTGGKNQGGNPATLDINFICDEKAGTGAPTAISTTGSAFKLEWISQYGCIAGVGGGRGFPIGGIFLILVFVGGALYLVTGVLLNKFLRHKEGKEIIPQKDFWVNFGGLIRDGGRFIVLKTCRRGGYSQV
eukprot:TRINITY_DN565_c0_g1_i4.p1 TRINITY_DN565_c0_g1~~TRINITY_DN565_c0_g1_i4.p1  ORF type:complete len:252 (-),score=37.71 TRINITY_DN565_c0_g1_i4:78-833(-)